MLEKLKGIVIRSIDYSESSIILSVYTAPHGMISLLLSGVRKSRSKTAPSIRYPLSIIEFSLFYKANRNIHRVKEINLSYIFSKIPFNMLHSSLVMFYQEVLYRCLYEEDGRIELFDYLEGQITSLDQLEKPPPDAPLRFLAELCKWMGYALPKPNKESLFDLATGHWIAEPPNQNDLFLTGKELELLQFHDRPLIRDRNIRNKLLNKLLIYLQLHIPGFGRIKSLAVLQQVWA